MAKLEYSLVMLPKCLIFLPYSSILNSMNNESRPYSHAVRALSLSIAFACRDGRSLQMIFSLLGMDIMLTKTVLTSILGGIYASVIDC